MPTPKRIISLVPSQTELLYHLGLNDEVIGITKFCVHPDELFRNKTRIGGTKTVDIAQIKSLLPDLIIANKEENVKEQIEQLQQIAPVYISDIYNLDDALTMIKDIGELIGKTKAANDLVAQIDQAFYQLSTGIGQAPTDLLRTAYLIWKDPYMAAGGGTFINDMLELCGFTNVFKSTSRYPEVTINQMSSVNCELLILSSEPYPFNQKHIDDIQQQLPQTKIILADGEMFSWYGSRLLQAPAYFKKVIEQVKH